MANIGCNPIGRLLAIYIHCIKQGNMLLIVSSIRLFIAHAIFFCYMNQWLIQGYNDYIACIYVVILSISSGYLLTCSYALVFPHFEEGEKLAAARFMNTAFLS